MEDPDTETTVEPSASRPPSLGSTPDGETDAEALLRGLLDGIQAGLAVVNTDLRVLYGGKPGETPGPTGGSCHEALFASDEPCSVCHAREVFETGEPRRALTEMRKLDGSPAWFEVLAFPLRGADGHIRNVIEMTRDVTREREMEMELQRSEKLAAVGRLAAGIAHEVKNPLGVIQSMVDVLANPARPEDQRDEAADLLRSEVSRLSTIVTDFLAYARPHAPVTREQDPTPVLHRSIEAWRRQSADAGPELVLDLAEDLPVRPIDADQIHQVLLNLLLNAEQAAGTGGRIAVTGARSQDGRLEITVSDDGPGIPADVRSRIFEPFFTTTHRGSGLGLSIVRQIVLAHDGRVEAEDRPGGGAAFRIVL